MDHTGQFTESTEAVGAAGQVYPDALPIAAPPPGETWSPSPAFGKWGTQSLTEQQSPRLFTGENRVQLQHVLLHPAFQLCSVCACMLLFAACTFQLLVAVWALC